MKPMKKRLLSLLLTLVTILSLLPTAAFAASNTGSGLKITTNQAYWSTRLLANGTPYSYRPPLVDGKLVYCMDSGLGYHYAIGMFFGGQPITVEEYNALTALRMENTGKVRGVFDVNFDKREFSAVHIMDGRRTWAMRDVSAAVYHATRSQFASSDDKWRKLLDHLSGKEITSAGHLSV